MRVRKCVLDGIEKERDILIRKCMLEKTEKERDNQIGKCVLEKIEKDRENLIRKCVLDEIEKDRENLIRKCVLDQIKKERDNQIRKSYTPEQDSIYKANELLTMAVWRIINSAEETPRPIKGSVDYHFMGDFSPDKWFKPCKETYKLVQAAALIVAELERRYRESEGAYMEEFFRKKITENEE